MRFRIPAIVFSFVGVAVLVGAVWVMPGIVVSEEIEQVEIAETLEERATRRAVERQSALDSLLAPYVGLVPERIRPSDVEVNGWADSVLATLSLEEKIGQLFVVDLKASWLIGARSLEQVARDWGVGGFHVSRSMAPRTVLGHTNRLQSVANVPLFFTADYERGVGQPSNNFAELPASMALGATANDVLAEAAGAVTAMEARATGVNVLFAPVADVNNNPANPIINTRSFGEDPTLVGQMAAAYTRGAQQHGALATLKHFPGHGNTDIDTHVTFGRVSGTWEDLLETELAPYKVALAERPGLVMTAHLWVRGLDESEIPATFSRRAIADVLRDSLGYDGIVTTDAIHMGALTSRYSFSQRMLRPIVAGADLILNTYNPRRGIRVIRDAVRSGSISEERIDESALRILRAKARLGLHRNRVESSGALEMMLAEVNGARVAQGIADASITLLEKGSALPIEVGSRVALVQLTNQSRGTSAAMARLERDLQSLTTLRSHRGGGRSTVLSTVRNSDVAVLALHLRVRQGAGTGLGRSQIQLARAVIQSGTPVVLVIFGNPYATMNLPEPDALVVAYDPSRRSATAAVDVLMDRKPASGRLPVSIPGRYAIGSGFVGRNGTVSSTEAPSEESN